jgi:hypothetical protein
VHENAHGYEYLRSAFTLEGYFYHGSGYYAFHHLFGGGQPEKVFMLNALFGAGSCMLLVPLGKRLTNSREAGWIAAIAYACWPMALRIGFSESMFPMAVFFGLLSWWAWFRAWDSGGGIWFLFAACALAYAVQTRPMMALWIVVLLLTLPLCRGWTRRLRTPWPWIALGLGTVLVLPWLAFRLEVFAQEGIPGPVRLLPMDVLGGLFSGTNLFARYDWTPALAWMLATCGLVVLVVRRIRAVPSLVLGAAILAWMVMGIRTGESSSLRLQNPLVPFFLLWVGYGASWIANRSGHRARYGLLFLLGLALAGSALARTPLVRRLHNPQHEYAFLEGTVPELPEACAIVMADRFMGNGIVSTEFPFWWAEGRPVVQASDFLERPDSLHDWSCVLYYQGLSCRCFTHEEVGRIPPDGIREECRRIGERFRLTTYIEESFPNRPYTSFRVPGESVTVGFYRVW